MPQACEELPPPSLVCFPFFFFFFHYVRHSALSLFKISTARAPRAAAAGSDWVSVLISGFLPNHVCLWYTCGESLLFSHSFRSIWDQACSLSILGE